MSRRVVGYKRMEWLCPNCEGRNEGTSQSCEHCGAPQPDNVDFYLPANAEWVDDENNISKAKAGADAHCAYCGTRNPAQAAECLQCGADMSEGNQRLAGREVAAAPDAEALLCENCGATQNSKDDMCLKCGVPLPGFSPPSAHAAENTPKQSPKNPERKRKQTRMLLIFAALLFLCCVAFFAIFILPSSDVQGTVADLSWYTRVDVQQEQMVRYSNEPGHPPSNADNVSCYDSVETVCEEKNIDLGNGFVEVVQECRDTTTLYCSYDVLEWRTLQTYEMSGTDIYPVYAQPNLSDGQRLGNEQLDMVVTFDTEKGKKDHIPESLSEFQRYTPGSQWILKLNAVGGILAVER